MDPLDLSNEELAQGLQVMEEMFNDVDELGSTLIGLTSELATKYPKAELEFMKGLTDRLHPDTEPIPLHLKTIVKEIFQLAIELQEAEE